VLPPVAREILVEAEATRMRIRQNRRTRNCDPEAFACPRRSQWRALLVTSLLAARCR
jgi:hypothetical protein